MHHIMNQLFDLKILSYKHKVSKHKTLDLEPPKSRTREHALLSSTILFSIYWVLVRQFRSTIFVPGDLWSLAQELWNGFHLS